jgi:hypothetical protein
MTLTYFLNDFEMVPVAPIITGVTLYGLSLSNVTYVVPVAVNYSYCIPDDGYGKCPKHVE